MNKWTGMGRLVRDPDVKFTDSGKCVARFVLAINYKYQGQDRAEFVQCECWEKVAQIIGEYCGKGDKILVEGHIRTTKYIKDNITRFSTRVIVYNIEFAEKKNRDTKKTPSNELKPVPEVPAGSLNEWPPIDQEVQDAIFSDEIPF